MKSINQYIIEKLRISTNIKELDWDDFVERFQKYGKELYLDEFCKVSGLETRPYYMNNVIAADPTYIFCDSDDDVMLCFYDPIIDDDNYTSLEDFLDIEKLFKGDDIIEKIIDYIS
jgi:hypothetical protein